MNANSRSALVVRFGSESLPSCKKPVFSPAYSFLRPSELFRANTGVLCGETILRSSLDADFKVTFTISPWEEYLGTEGFVFFQARIQLCMLMLSGGWASERSLPDV